MARSGLGMRMCSGVSAVRKSRPASRRSTRTAASSLSRAASTAPAEPPPTMTKSYSCNMPASLRTPVAVVFLALGCFVVAAPTAEEHQRHQAHPDQQHEEGHADGGDGSNIRQA